MSILDIKAREFDEQTQAAAAQVIAEVAAARNETDLPIYEGAVAIDGAQTKDRDDAIKLSEDEHYVLVETFIADPTRFITPGDLIDIAAKQRLYTLYQRKNKRSPLMPPSLSEGVFSLDADKISPAVRMATKLDKHTGAIVSVTYERCWVKAENMTYEAVAKKIAAGDERLTQWNQIAKWLRERRQKNAKGELLPSYDPDSGIYRKEDGQISYVDPKLINAHNIVQEAMILANHSFGLVMKSCFEYALYKGQEEPQGKSEYMDFPGIFPAVGLDPYTHGSSPLRRYPDHIVHQFLGVLGDKFELTLDGSKPPIFPAPLDRGELQALMEELNKYGKQLKYYYKSKREEQAARWLEKNFSNTNPEKFKAYKPDVFSDRLKIAASKGIMNDAFADEVKSRLKHEGKFGLVMPRDAVSILRHIRQKGNRDNSLWLGIAMQVIDQLERDPSMLEKVFDTVMSKSEFQDFHVRKSSFFTRPSKDPDERRRYSVAAAAVVATQGERSFTSSRFYLSPSHNMAELRAKIEFLRDYASFTLKTSDSPKFPEDDKTYLADGRHFEQADELRTHLERAGYEVLEIPGAPVDEKTPQGFQHILEISRNGKMEFDVVVTSEEAEEARKIALEVASHELNGRDGDGFDRENLGHPGSTSFAARFPKKTSSDFFKRIITERPQVLPHPRTAIASKGACEALDDILGSQGYLAGAHGPLKVKKDLRITPGRSKDMSLEKIAARIAELLPYAAVVTRPGTSIIIENAPPYLVQLCEQRQKKQTKDRNEKLQAIRSKVNNKGNKPFPNGNGRNNGHGR